MLLAHALGHPRRRMPTRGSSRMSTDTLDAAANCFNELIERRLAGEPSPYLIGHRASSTGETFAARPAALIPRPETELLIDLALERLPSDFSGRILDVSTGTGCIAVTLALERPRTQITALDVSDQRASLAYNNAAALGATNDALRRKQLVRRPNAGDQFDLIVNQPPYIVPGDAHLSQGRSAI